ncbi:hypothetical protein [Streptomyces sp. NPDC050121]|uniref:hypothetical protein n=1 Tax=Streptomyces sp. NPDC050121 TaxID=3365601 RepID=UPI0037958078
MNGTAQAGLGYLALFFVLGALLIRYGATGGKPRRHRGPRAPRRIEVEVPGHHLIPALAGPGWPQPAFRHCIGCQHTVPVVVHDHAHRCDAGHTTIHATTGDHR